MLFLSQNNVIVSKRKAGIRKENKKKRLNLSFVCYLFSPFPKAAYGIKANRFGKIKIYSNTKGNSICLVKCLIALVSKGIKQAWKGL